MFTGDSLLIGDVGRPDLHVAGDAAGQARQLYASLARLLELSDDVLVLPSHYAGSVCGRGALGNPFSLDRVRARAQRDARPRRRGAFAAALLRDTPPRPAEQEAIVARNRRGAAPRTG